MNPKILIILIFFSLNLLAVELESSYQPDKPDSIHLETNENHGYQTISSYQFGFLQSSSKSHNHHLTGTLIGMSGQMKISRETFLVCDVWGAGLKPQLNTAEAFKGVGTVGFKVLTINEFYLKMSFGRYLEQIFNLSNQEMTHNQIGWLALLSIEKQWYINEYLRWGLQSFLATSAKLPSWSYDGLMQGWSMFLNINLSLL